MARRPGGFDRVLVDAPCSDLGALASRPDARWRKSPRQIERLVEVQDADPARRPRPPCARAASLVYSTCTISRRENEERIAALLEAAGGGEVPPLVVEDLGARAPALASTGRSALPAAAPRPRSHDRILHLPPETG